MFQSAKWKHLVHFLFGRLLATHPVWSGFSKAFHSGQCHAGKDLKDFKLSTSSATSAGTGFRDLDIRDLWVLWVKNRQRFGLQMFSGPSSPSGPLRDRFTKASIGESLSPKGVSWRYEDIRRTSVWSEGKIDCFRHPVNPWNPKSTSRFASGTCGGGAAGSAREEAYVTKKACVREGSQKIPKTKVLHSFTCLYLGDLFLNRPFAAWMLYSWNQSRKILRNHQQG